MTPTPEAPALVLTELKQTCFACPSQWEGMTACGRPVYVRFRHGYVSVRLGPVGGDVMSAVCGEEILGINHPGVGDYCGFSGDGVMTTEAMAEVVRGVLVIPDFLIDE